MASRLAAWTALVLLSGTSIAAPGISFPINSQVPPVARVGQPFSFIFSPSTFTSASAISYTLANPPRWLSVDGAARRLYGTPSDTDIGPGQVVGVPVSLVATDATGSATLDATLVVSRSLGPKLNVPLERQVPQFGTFSGPSSVMSAPQTQFSFDLTTDTFLNPSNSPLIYYAVMADNSPLPAWISFDPARLSFSGRTPPSESLIQPPQRFAFQVVASDVVGFAAASLQLDIVVGSDIPPLKHQITADRTTISLNATVGKDMSYTGLRGHVQVDGKPATAEVSITSVTDAPPWVSVDKNTWDIRGAPTESAKSTSFTIVLQDKSYNTLNLTIAVQVTPETPRDDDLFKGTISELTATAGELFSFDLGKYLASPKDTEVSIMTDSASWVRFDSSKTVVCGDVPKDAQDSTVRISVEAKSKTSGKSETISLTMRIRASGAVANKASPDPEKATRFSSPTGGSTASVTENSLASTTDDYASAPPNLLLLAVLLPTFIIIPSVTCLLFWCYRRRKERKRPKPTTRGISGPLPGTFVMNATGPFNYGYYSTQDFTTQPDDPHADQAISEEKGYIESRSTYLSNSSVPRPSATVRLLSPIEGSPSSDDVFGSGIAPLLSAGATPRPQGPNRYGLRNDRSLSSILETSMYEENSGAPISVNKNIPTLPLHNLAGTPFRDAVEVHIPTLARDTSSITQTPESAYTAPRSSPLDTSASGSDQSDVRPLRAESRLGHYPAMATRKFAWPWLKKTITLKSNATRSHSRKPSTTTIDTFAYKKTPDAQYNQTPISPPRSARLPAQPTPSMRPVTRRGPIPGQSTTGSFAQNLLPPDALLPSSPTMGYAVQPPPAQANWLPQPIPADSLGIRTPVQRDYSDLVGKGPFHVSMTWSSLNDGDEWADETVQSQSVASVSQLNWTMVAAGTAVGTESPKVGGNLYLSGSKELGSELGSELLSPDKWPRAEGHGKGRVGAATPTGWSAYGKMSPIRVAEGSGGIGKQSQPQGLSLVSDGSPRFL